MKNEDNVINAIIAEINQLSEEGRKKLERRARDKFNKNRKIRMNMVSTMILGGLIHKDDLC